MMMRAEGCTQSTPEVHTSCTPLHRFRELDLKIADVYINDVCSLPMRAHPEMVLTLERGHAHTLTPNCRGTSFIRKRTPLGPYRRPVPRVLGEP